MTMRLFAEDREIVADSFPIDAVTCLLVHGLNLLRAPLRATLFQEPSCVYRKDRQVRRNFVLPG
jgi:hypothetical protein